MKALSILKTAAIAGVLAITTFIPEAGTEETTGALSFSQGSGEEQFLSQTNGAERRRVRRRTRRRVNRRQERRENKMIDYTSTLAGNVWYWSA